jgi:hypothetical protein
VTLQKLFFTSKFSYLLSFNPTYETETRTQQIGEELLLLIANHLDQSLWWPIRKSESHWSRSQIISITFVYAGAQGYYCAFYEPPQSVQLCWSKTIFPQPNWYVLTFLHPISMCRITDWAPLEMLLHQEGPWGSKTRKQSFMVIPPKYPIYTLVKKSW